MTDSIRTTSAATSLVAPGQAVATRYRTRPAKTEKHVALEIAHVLFIDIVGYSTLSSSAQHAVIDKLTEIVRTTGQCRTAEIAGRLVKIPSGDGMALVFYTTPEAPVECALEISSAAKALPDLKLRMGVHSGPVGGLIDVNDRVNVAGAGINVAQRVMDCADAGHILLSRRAADDLEQYDKWRPLLHDLGQCEFKHGMRLGIANLYTHELGNAETPKKLQDLRNCRARARWARVAAAVITLGALIAGMSLLLHRPTYSGFDVPEKSVAVLPFDNLSSGKENAFFTDGMQDEILAHLAKIADLRVISRTSVMQYEHGAARNVRKIGKELGVAHIVEGTVQRSGNKVRVNAQLLDARNDAQVWGQTYDRDLADVFVIQSEIAKAIADQLQAKLSLAEKTAIEQPPTTDLIAFDQYSRAKTLILTTSMDVSADKALVQAIDLLNSAVGRDPSFYSAFCQLVGAHDRLYSVVGDHTPERLHAAEAALQRAIALRPDAAETHLVRGAHLYYAFRDYNGAIAELKTAGLGLPNDPRVFAMTGFIQRRQGNYEEALRALEQAVKLDPRNTFTLSQLSITYQLLRRYPERKATLQRVLEITPDDVGEASEGAFVDFLWRADPAPFHQFIERLRTERPAALGEAADNWLDCALAERDWVTAEKALTALGGNFWWVDNAVSFNRHFGEGLRARAMDDKARARKAFEAARAEQVQVVEKQKDYGPALCVLGVIDAGLGNKQTALQEGRRAMQLVPVEKDSVNGQAMVAYFALIAAWTGEKDLAVQQLAIAAPTPGASLIASYGILKLSPFWDSLRGDPRFEKIVSSLAPKSSHRSR